MMKSYGQKHYKLGKYLMENDNDLPATLFQTFCKIILNYKLIVKSMLDPYCFCRKSEALMGWLKGMDVEVDGVCQLVVLA